MSGGTVLAANRNLLQRNPGQEAHVTTLFLGGTKNSEPTIPLPLGRKSNAGCSRDVGLTDGHK